MQRRHFEAIAAVVRELPLPQATNNIHNEPIQWRDKDGTRRVIAERFADMCAREYRGSASFDRASFLRACGVE